MKAAIAIIMTPEQAREMLILSLAQVRERFDADADDWRFGLLRTFREYALAIGVDKSLLHPVQQMINETVDATFKARRREAGERGAPMPKGKAWPLTFAAAAVTELKRRGEYQTVPMAVGDVSRLAGIEQKSLTHFRKNLSGNASFDVMADYAECLRKFGDWDTSEIKGVLPPLRDFLK
jgi:hypothetical protein